MNNAKDHRAFVVRIDDHGGNRPYYVETLDSSALTILPYFPSEEAAFRKKLVTLVRGLEIGDSLRVQKGKISVHVDVRDGRPRTCPICGRDTEHPSAVTCGRDECFNVNVQRQTDSE
jgi:hypothetical protein